MASLGSIDKKLSLILTELQQQKTTNNFDKTLKEIIDEVHNEDDEKKQQQAPVGPVIRWDINDTTDKKYDGFRDRYAAAIKKMMENKKSTDGDDIPGTSEYYQIASYHNYPGTIYCAHGTETFPAWHRVYLVEFEKLFMAADKANGNDGRLGLPYWDWTTNPSLPDVITKELNEFPEDLFETNDNLYPPMDDPEPDKYYGGLPFTRTLFRASNITIAINLGLHQSENPTGKFSNDIAKANENSLKTYPTHYEYACMPGGMYSLEIPHNEIHVSVGECDKPIINKVTGQAYIQGGQMGYNQYAAFDPVFFLHHCNVDRLYEQFLQVNNTQNEMEESFKKNQYDWHKRDQTHTDLYKAPLEPFVKDSGDYYYPRDIFNTEKLDHGYRYDRLCLSSEIIQTLATIKTKIKNILVEMEIARAVVTGLFQNNALVEMQTAHQNGLIEHEAMLKTETVKVLGRELSPKPKARAVFKNIKVSELPMRHLQIFVFVINAENETEFKEPETRGSINFSSPNFGGVGVIWAGSEHCKNCQTSPPYDLSVDISDAVNKLDISADNVVLKVYCLAGSSQHFVTASHARLPEPTKKGSFFKKKK